MSLSAVYDYLNDLCRKLPAERSANVAHKHYKRLPVAYDFSHRNFFPINGPLQTLFHKKIIQLAVIATKKKGVPLLFSR